MPEGRVVTGSMDKVILFFASCISNRIQVTSTRDVITKLTTPAIPVVVSLAEFAEWKVVGVDVLLVLALGSVD